MSECKTENNTFNEILGWKLMQIRQGRKMSREELGHYIGVRGQQINKYETGENRISAESLSVCARVLDVPIDYFYEGHGTCPKHRYDKRVLTIAAEVSGLPSEVQKSLYDFCRTINRLYDEREHLRHAA